MNHPNAPPVQGIPLPPPPALTQSSQQHHHHHQQQQQQTQQLPPPNLHLQSPLTRVVSNQHYQPLPITTAHQSQSIHPTTQSHYISHPQPYSASGPGILHHSADPNFFNAHPSPYSTQSASGSYTSSDTNDAMAQAAMSRQHYPPISSYHTPQSNSPASIHSPQHDASGRSMYAMPTMASSMFYNQHYTMQQPAYAQQPPPSILTQQALPSSSAMMMQHSQAPPQQHHSAYHHPTQPSPVSHHHQQQSHPQNMIKSEPPPPLQRPPSVVTPQLHSTPQQPPPLSSHQHQQQTPQTSAGPNAPYDTLGSSAGANPGTAPGPIPATTPLVVRQDPTGVQWIKFEYSRDRIKMEYTIRCDVENVKTENLSQEFKSANCVYPRACGPRDNYKGNRLQYETDCNNVGWALAELNPSLREKRGLIQRAVDSWRNSNQDMKMRSRRVRRQLKMQTRKGVHAGQANQMQTSTQLPPDTSAQNSAYQQQQQHQMIPSSSRSASISGPVSQNHHHHHGDSQDGRDVSASDPYSSISSTSQQVPSNGLPSPASVRYTQNFYPSYPQQPGIGASTMPSVHDGMNSLSHHPSTTLATSITASTNRDEDEEVERRSDIPGEKGNKFIMVEDTQRNCRVRIGISFDQVKLDDMPDSYLHKNSVYPRSYYSRVMHSPPGSPRARGIFEDDEDGVADNQRGRTMVSVPTIDTSENQTAMLPIPRLTRTKRRKELALNELGYLMSWGKPPSFHDRTIFLQRTLDTYRNKMNRNLTAKGQDAPIAPHLETRPGKRRYLERSKRQRRGSQAS